MDFTRDELSSALVAWAYWTACAEPVAEAGRLSLGWLEALWGRGEDALPWTLVHDVGFLLMQGRTFRFASAVHLAAWPAQEREARLNYEGRVLARLALDPSILELHIAIAAMRPELQTDAVVHALAAILGPHVRAVAGRRSGNAAHLRSLKGDALERLAPSAARPEGADSNAPSAACPEGADSNAPSAAQDDGTETAWRAWALDDLASCVEALPRGRLVAEECVWEVAHLAELPDESARLALRQVFAVRGALGSLSPALAARMRRIAGEVPQDADSADHYPTGGIDAISTRGLVENLVRTELVYVGEGAGGVGDLFDVRYAEGDLLYYTRDESPTFEAHRALTLVIDRPAELRHKLATLSAQNLVLVHGVILALLSDLSALFGPRGYSARIVHHGGSHQKAVALEESSLLGMALAADIAHRRVTLDVVDQWVAGRGHRVVFSPGPRPREEVGGIWVRVGGESWSVDDVPCDVRPESGRAIVDALLLPIVGLQQRGARRRSVRFG
jgi:hypothetical protein